VITTHNPETLKAFTASIAEEFEKGGVPGPVHLAGGNEDELIRVFENVQPDDWCFSTWRSHYHALLKGVPEDELRTEILAGRSITLQFPKHRFLTSAIVAGHLPIAVGVALQIKRQGGSERVWAFLGDMAAGTGLAHECFRFAMGHNLPIRFVIEDNGVSVCTPTKETWGHAIAGNEYMFPNDVAEHYKYDLPFPHAGGNRRTNF
jgi:TPP-dependent pyruvate/acetoin dehydrogenase alpha subunit